MVLRLQFLLWWSLFVSKVFQNQNLTLFKHFGHNTRMFYASGSTSSTKNLNIVFGIMIQVKEKFSFCDIHTNNCLNPIFLLKMLVICILRQKTLKLFKWYSNIFLNLLKWRNSVHLYYRFCTCQAPQKSVEYR